MSDSEGTKDLSGIARSVDALFSSRAPRDDVLETDEDSGVEAPPEPPNVAGDSLTGAPVPPELPSAVEASGDLESALDLESMDDAGDGPLDFDPFGEAGTDGDADPEVEAFAADTEAEDAFTEADSGVEDPAAEVSEPVPPAETGAESRADAEEPEEEPSPIELAVQAYLAGDRSKASEIQGMAEELLQARSLDPVARAVGELAIGAGEPPDEETVEVARSIATPVVYGRLARQIGAEREEDRRQAFFLACRNLGKPMGVAIRDDLAESTDRHARRIHCDALVAMGRTGRRIIEEMVEDENRFLVRNAVAILGDTGGDRAVELVTSALANPDARVRKEALRSLAKLGDEDSGELVLGLLEDPDPQVRVAAAVAAGELHVERALRSIIKMLDATSDPDEAIPLMRALGHLRDPGAVSSIEKQIVPKLFSRPRTDVRIVGYRALHQIGTPHARRLLNQALDDKDPEVKAAVKEILGMR